MADYLELMDFETPLLFKTFANSGMEVGLPHWHKEIEIIYSVEGEVNVWMNNDVFRLQQGEIYYFASGEAYSFLASPNSKRYVYQFDLHLFESEMDVSIINQLFEEGIRHSVHWPPVLTKEVCRLLEELYEINQEVKNETKYLIMSDMYRLVACFMKYLPKKNHNQEYSENYSVRSKQTMMTLHKIFKYVDENFTSTISIEDVAKAIGFSPSYFSRFFKWHTGQTFMEFLREYRINKAKIILLNEKLPIIEVSEKAGFSSLNTFYRAFKLQEGISPLQYQKKVGKLL